MASYLMNTTNSAAAATLGEPPPVRWLMGLLDLAPRYGKFVAIRLDELGWARAMSNVWCKPLYEKMRGASRYVIPIAGFRGSHAIQQISSVMGLWLEGAAEQWGVAPTANWYVDARFVMPGVYGVPKGPEAMPPSLYRAMILNGAMTGGVCVCIRAQPGFMAGRRAQYVG